MFGSGFPGFKFGGFGTSGHEEEQEMPSGNESEQQDVDTNKLYELLGVGKNASHDEVKKAFRKKAIKLHPDKGGDPQKFAEISEAYEILSNPEKRDLYDKYGIEGVKSGGPPGMGGFNDIFDLFTGGGLRGGPKQPQKVKPILRELVVKLEDIYTGNLIKITQERKRTCDKCEGKGGSKVEKCSTCKGKGIVQKMVQLGPGMYQQSSQPCIKCKGQGKIIEEKDKCMQCKGQRIITQIKEIDVPVEQGVPDEHDYIFYGDADEIPGAMAGDLYVRIKTDKHPYYTRKGADLFYDKQITLLEALIGFSFEIKHLDNSKINITTHPGDIISYGDTRVIKGKGMPFYKDPMSHGNLYIRFQVEFPKRGSLKQNHIEELKKILPGPKLGPSDNKNAFTLEDFDESEMNTNVEGGRNKGDEEDEEELPRGAQRVQCAQQ